MHPNRNILRFIGLIGVIMCPLNIYCQEEKAYNVRNNKFENIEGQLENKFNFNEMKVIKREHYMNGTFNVFEDLNDEDHELEVKMYSSPNSDGVYQLLAMGIPKGPVCEAMHKFFVKFVQPSLIEGENTNFPYIDPENGLCPIPKGDYWIKDITIDTSEWPTNFPRGTLKVVITFYNSDVTVGGTTVYFLIEDNDN